jgi:predicted nucleotidyltransferase
MLVDTRLHYPIRHWYNSNMSNEELVKLRRPEILAIAHHYGARNVRIFGSVARGEARPDSDIDFLVELEPGRSLFDLGGMLYELQELLGVQVDVVTRNGLRPRFREQVVAEAIPL